VRCPHCFNFVTVPKAEPSQVKIVEPPTDEPPLIVFRCAHCQSRMETEPANAGLACICPGCHVSLTIPGNARPIFPRPEQRHSSERRGFGFDTFTVTIMVLIAALAGALIAFGLVPAVPLR
jgi:hypothetical protein